MRECALESIQITDSAKTHFKQLLDKESVSGMALRIFLDYPGLPTADIGIAFCPPGEEKSTDLLKDCGVFLLYVDALSLPYLKEAVVDYQVDALGGQLAIKAPYLRGPKPEEGASLFDRVSYILNNEVNPNLAHHGGMVRLVEITDDKVVVLQFGGGCQGCGMVDMTLRNGIERTLLEQLPEITAVRDVTAHEEGSNPYY